VYRKCPARNSTVQLSPLYTDTEPSNSTSHKFPVQYEEECIHYMAYLMLAWCTCRSRNIVCILFLADLHFQCTTIGYISNSCFSCYVFASVICLVEEAVLVIDMAMAETVARQCLIHWASHHYHSTGILILSRTGRLTHRTLTCLMTVTSLLRYT